MSLVAGVDSSTQSTKVEVRDADTGEIVAEASAPHPPTTPPVSEQDPGEWWAAFESAWERIGAPRVDAISVAGQQHGLVALDADARPIRPAKLWNDTESAPDAGWLWAQLPGGRAEWAEAVGSVPLAAFTVTKLSWLHRCEPAAWERLARVVLPHDYLTHRLTGAFVTDRGDASGTGYWSPSTGEYRWDVLAIVDGELDWTEVVPRVLGPRESAGEWRSAVVGAGTGDNMAAALGLALDRGDAVISVGTSGTVFSRSAHPTADGTGAVAGFADATGGFLPLVCTSNGAKVLDAVRRLLGVDEQEFDRLALDASDGDLVLLPYLDGERTPDLPNATGWMSGLRSDVTRGQLARAAVTGVVCGLIDGLDELRLHADVSGRVVLTGGAAHSAALRAILAAMCDRPVVHARTEQAVAAGACVQAATVLGAGDPLDVARSWQLDRVDLVEPASSVDAGAVRARYAELRDKAYPR
jgi:xylulokinase